MSALQGVFSIVGAITGRIVEPVIQLVVLHVGFVVQYKKKQEKLEVEIKNLEEKRKQIEEKVDEAITRGEEVDEPVSNWLVEVEERLQKIKDDNIINENMQCFKFSCPDYISRYRMSKEAENKMKEVRNLTQSGNFSTVAHPKPFAQELQFPSSSANYANFESRKSVCENIMAALQDSNVKMIGVYGTGGVGKTTMVEEIGKQVKNVLFDEVVVAVVSQDANVSNIQGQLAVRLGLKLIEKTEVGKANELWNRLNNGKKNLIILDDIWQELNLKTIGVPITYGNKGCKIVITSRIRGVLEKMEVDRYFPMQVLLEKEAWALFKKKVGNFVDSPELHDIADAVCKECGGLPVAILAVGAALKDKKKYVWEDVLDQFKDSMLKNIAGIEPKVYASLKLSYDRLESSDAKSCFLLCCFFPEDANISIEVLARHCIARSLLGQNTNTLIRASRRVLTVVDILKDACLLLEGEDENFVKMHDVIRDVALSIAKDDGKEILVKHGDKKWPEKDICESSSAMSLMFDNTLELPDDLVCPQLHTLTIVLEWDWHRDALLNVPDRFFSRMEKLTILELNRICMLPPLSLANLVNLRMLWLEGCELGDIAILKDLNNNLEILSLQGSNIEVLPSEIRQLTRLRLLDVRDCEKLTEIPQGVISNLSRLEELYILDEHGYREERSKVNLDELGKLTELTTLQIHIPNVMLLPKDSCFENLIRFKIVMGKEFDFSGTHDSFRTYSKSCELAGVSLMDKLIVLLMRAEQLHLQKIEGLQEVLHDRGAPSGFFNNLIELTVRDCRLKYLFSLSCARGFPRLQRLRIFDCEMMEAIVGIEEEKDEDELSSQVINFSQLKYLHLWNLPKLISFYPKVEKMSTSEGNSSTQAKFLFNEKRNVQPQQPTTAVTRNLPGGRYSIRFGNYEAAPTMPPVRYDANDNEVMDSDDESTSAIQREAETHTLAVGWDTHTPSTSTTKVKFDNFPDHFPTTSEDDDDDVPLGYDPQYEPSAHTPTDYPNPPVWDNPFAPNIESLNILTEGGETDNEQQQQQQQQPQPPPQQLQQPAIISDNSDADDELYFKAQRRRRQAHVRQNFPCPYKHCREKGLIEYEGITAVHFVKLCPEARMPSRATDGAVGYDLSSTTKMLIQPQDRCLIPTGIALQIPFGMYGRIAPRSGLALEHGIHVGAGVIDPDYRGEVKVLLFNFDLKLFKVQPGQRIAQIIFEKVALPRMVQQDGLLGTTRDTKNGNICRSRNTVSVIFAEKKAIMLVT
ncbi:unnamed protein product [Camellia sinensis]